MARDEARRALAARGSSSRGSFCRATGTGPPVELALVVDGAIGLLAGFALDDSQRFYAVLIIAGLFLVVVVMVGVITFLAPREPADGA